MKTKIFAAAALVLALLGMSYAVTTQGQVTISPTCGISLSAQTLNFGDMNTGDTSTSDQSTTVTNDGSVLASVSVQGNDWTDGVSNSFAVGQTHYALTGGQDYDSGMTALTSGPVFFSSIGNGASQDGFFKLRIPLGQAAASYTQDITFTSSCD